MTRDTYLIPVHKADNDKVAEYFRTLATCIEEDTVSIKSLDVGYEGQADDVLEHNVSISYYPDSNSDTIDYIDAFFLTNDSV